MENKHLVTHEIRSYKSKSADELDGMKESSTKESSKSLLEHHLSEPKDYILHRNDSKFATRQEKAAFLLEHEHEQQNEVEREFENMKLVPNVGTSLVGIDPAAQKIVSGFRINHMNMRDAKTGIIMWESDRFDDSMFHVEIEENIPKEILQCEAVSREIDFTSAEAINNFRIEQRIFFAGQCLEEWLFTFGFVIPGSSNCWQQLIEAVPPEQMMTASALSGKVTVETSFFDGSLFLCKNLVRIHYV